MESRLRIHSLDKSREEIELGRMMEFYALPTEEKIRRALVLMNIARKFNGGKPLKQPQGKGVIFYKPNKDGSV